MRAGAWLFICLVWQVAKGQSYDIITVNLENDAVSRYLNEVTYTREDTSLIASYNVSPPDCRDIPRPVTISLPETADDTIFTLVYADNDRFDAPRTVTSEKGDRDMAVWNLVPQQTYYYKLMVKDSLVSQGEIHTEGQLRMIYVPNIHNIRDLGGWKSVTGRTVKYGKIIRGMELNGDFVCDPADIVKMKEDTGIAAELDLRAWYNDESGVSAFGFVGPADLPSTEVPTYHYSGDSGQLPEHLIEPYYLTRWNLSFNFIVNNMKLNRSIYMHCVYGANRTGYMSFLLEGLLGVDYDQLMKDYELTSFYNNNETKEKMDSVFDFIDALKGETLQERFRTFFIDNMEVSCSDVDYFIDEMLEPNTDESITTDRRCVREQKEVYYNLQGMMVGDGRGKNLLIERRPDGSVIKYVK